MSGSAIGRALHDRFHSVRRSEFERLKRKLGGLNERDRQSAEAIVADVVNAIVQVPARALSEDSPLHALEAVVRLFDLDLKQIK